MRQPASQSTQLNSDSHKQTDKITKVNLFEEPKTEISPLFRKSGINAMRKLCGEEGLLTTKAKDGFQSAVLL